MSRIYLSSRGLGVGLSVALIALLAGCMSDGRGGRGGGDTAGGDSGMPVGRDTGPAPDGGPGEDSDVPGAVCGNGDVEGDEDCDDGNTESGDGCSAFCVIEDPCGDGT